MHELPPSVLGNVAVVKRKDFFLLLLCLPIPSLFFHGVLPSAVLWRAFLQTRNRLVEYITGKTCVPKNIQRYHKTVLKDGLNKLDSILEKHNGNRILNAVLVTHHNLPSLGPCGFTLLRGCITLAGSHSMLELSSLYSCGLSMLLNKY